MPLPIPEDISDVSPPTEQTEVEAEEDEFDLELAEELAGLDVGDVDPSAITDEDLLGD